MTLRVYALSNVNKSTRCLAAYCLFAIPVPNACSQNGALINLDTYLGCGMEGDARSPGVQALNRLKNRYVTPGPQQINRGITLAAIVAPGNDMGRWRVKQAAEIAGYVFDVMPGGIETTNCHAHDIGDRDTHIELVVDPMAASPNQRVIIEVTPRWRAIMRSQDDDWSTRALRDKLLGRWVRVTGWMLFDSEHPTQSENTAPGRARNWRATAWEVHPITSIEVIQRPAK